jgi:alkylation response protein AidB-like acyl-CoA dehydrogenase
MTARVHVDRRSSSPLTDEAFGRFSIPREWIPETHLELLAGIRRWADEDVMPVRHLIDDDWEQHAVAHPLLEKLAVEVGYQRACWSADYGGGGIDTMTSLLALEEMARADSGLATAASCSIWAMSPIFPPRENALLMDLFTPRFLATDRWYVGSAAITDARSGSDVENLDGTHGKYIQTVARLHGDEWVIDGHKRWPTNSGGLADVFAVFCTTDPAGGDDAFAIIYVPADTPGVRQGSPIRKAGMSGDLNSDVWFENVRVPAEHRAHGPGTDALAARAFIASGNVGTAAQCIGVMRDIDRILRGWVDSRVVGGKPLKEHSITAAVLADVSVAIETSRAETYLKGRMLMEPERYGPRDSPEMLARTRVTKLFVSDQLTRVVNLAMDLMGAAGYAREAGLEKHWRDSKIMSLWMGGRALPQLDIARWFYAARTY